MTNENRALALLRPIYERFIGRTAKPAKNPNRVAGGRKAAETRRRNKEIAAALDKWEGVKARAADLDAQVTP